MAAIMRRVKSCLSRTHILFVFILILVGIFPAPSNGQAQTQPDGSGERRSIMTQVEVPAPAASPSQDGAPDHCEITGNTRQYEGIESANLWSVGNGLYYLRVVIQYVVNLGGEDPFPGLFLNAWMDWHNDGVWSDMVVDTYVNANAGWGRMTYETTFKKPAGITVAPATWLRVMITEDDWEYPCVDFPFYGDYIDLPVSNLTDEVIGDITVTGIGTFRQKPTTGSMVELSAHITLPPGWTKQFCIWTGDLFPGLGSGDNCSYTYYAFRGSGPSLFTYGLKSAWLTVVVSYEKVATTLKKPVSYNVYFKRDGDDDGNGIPNWFEYWKDDGAVPVLNTSATPIEFAQLSHIRGEYSRWFDTIYVGPDASEELENGGLTTNPLPATGTCPGGSFTPKAQGIDSVATAIAHEARHKWSTVTQWNTEESLGGWKGLYDTDYRYAPFRFSYWDYLPDSYEWFTLYTSAAIVDSCDLEHNKDKPYKYYGDNEWVSVTYADGEKGVAGKDWANPGQQAGFLVTLSGVESDLQAQAGMPEIISGPPSTGIPPSNPTQLYNDMATLTGSYTSEGEDTDGNGLFNSLKLSVGTNIIEAERYSITAWLQQDSSATPIAWATTTSDLEAGDDQTVDLYFDGIVLRNAGLDGPYKVSRLEMYIGDSELVADAADNPHTTSALAALSFDIPQVTFNSFSDTGVTGAGGLYDLLRVSVNVDVKTAATYTLTGELYGTHVLAVAGTTQSLPQGASQTVNLDFNGQSIYGNRQDGPYALKVSVEDDSGNLINFNNAAATSAYTYDLFQHSGTTFDATSYSDQGVDTNNPPNGKNDFLQVNLDVMADQAGVYILSANLSDSQEVVFSSVRKDVKLSTGINHLSLDFSGSDIVNHAVDGVYQVTALTLASIDSEAIDQHPYAYTTASYNYNDFEAPLFTVSGQVTGSGGAGLAGVTVSDGTRSDDTDSEGNFTIIGMPAGSYTLTAAKSGYSSSPATYPLEVVDSSIIGLNFTASASVYKISGEISPPLAGVTVSDGTRTSAPTGADGKYEISGVPAGTYTLMPSKAGYTFSPTTLSATVTNADVTGKDFNATQTEYTLTITSAHGTVAKNPNQAKYHEGDVVQLTATPNAGWAFAKWTGGLTGTANPSSVTIHGNTAVTANYSKISTLTFNSIASSDGWVLEKSENSNTGGSLDSASTTLRLGDDNLKKQYRSILSFITAGLPDNAVITSVTLKIKQQSVTGGATFNMFQGLLVDIRKGPFGTSALQTTDFQATASKTGVGPFTAPAVGGWYTFNLTTAKAYINKLTTNSGLTQFRLRFKLDDNNNSIANYISFFSGNSTTNKPILTIQYYVP